MASASAARQRRLWILAVLVIVAALGAAALWPRGASPDRRKVLTSHAEPVQARR
jgi:hypothetical protein